MCADHAVGAAAGCTEELSEHGKKVEAKRELSHDIQTCQVKIKQLLKKWEQIRNDLEIHLNTLQSSLLCGYSWNKSHVSEIGEDIFILLYNQIVPIISVPVQAKLAPPDNGPHFCRRDPGPAAAACSWWLVPDPRTGSRDTHWCHPSCPLPSPLNGARCPTSRHHNSYVLTIPNLGFNWFRSSTNKYLTNRDIHSEWSPKNDDFTFFWIDI